MNQGSKSTTSPNNCINKAKIINMAAHFSQVFHKNSHLSSCNFHPHLTRPPGWTMIENIFARSGVRPVLHACDGSETTKSRIRDEKSIVIGEAYPNFDLSSSHLGLASKIFPFLGVWIRV